MLLFMYHSLNNHVYLVIICFQLRFKCQFNRMVAPIDRSGSTERTQGDGGNLVLKGLLHLCKSFFLSASVSNHISLP